MMLKDKCAFITGAAQGIGKSIATGMARAGADIAVVDVNIERAQNTAREIEELGVKSLAIQADVSSQKEVGAAYGSFMEVFGKLDILVNNAGITRDALILRMKDEDWDLAMDINLKGTFLCCKEAIKIMTKQKNGKIVNISSVVAYTGNPGQANYSASKAGIVGLTKTIAKEYAGRGVRANAVAPGFIQTAMTEVIPDKIKEQMRGAIPLGSFGTTDDVANAVIFLSSQEADYITGQVLHVNGGMYM
jgi:3-oxoacyl-[acyl-carrier protein] reductase